MASTITLSRSTTLASAFIRYAPLNLSANDPGFSNADWVRQMILGPPFAWRWNRAEVSFNTVVGQSDYKVSASSLGWIEKAVLYLPVNGNEAQELEIENNLTAESLPNKPIRISAQLDDGQGNITFRLVPSPDQVYKVTVVYQLAAPTFQNNTDTWAPIPDYMSYLYNQGLLSKSLEYFDDPRAQGSMQEFYQLLVAASQGLSDDQKNIFLSDRMNTQRQTQNVAQGRG